IPCLSESSASPPPPCSLRLRSRYFAGCLCTPKARHSHSLPTLFWSRPFSVGSGRSSDVRIQSNRKYTQHLNDLPRKHLGFNDSTMPHPFSLSRQKPCLSVFIRVHLWFDPFAVALQYPDDLFDCIPITRGSRS